MEPDFAGALLSCLQQIPRGRVATCGTIARSLGDVRAARAVATWIREHPGTPGSHRIVRADGRPISSGALQELANEGLRPQGNRVPKARFVGSLAGVGLFTALREEQVRLERAVVEADPRDTFRSIAGVDLAYEGSRAYAVAVCIDAQDLEPLEIACVRYRVDFPYVPTYLGYREIAGIEGAVNRLSHRPDVLLVDGHGRLHPARFGVACFVGVRLGMPTIGVGKHPLAGRVASDPRAEIGAHPVMLKRAIQGYAWRPPHGSRLIYVSVGNRISLEGAFETIRNCTRDVGPEPLKIADRISKEMKRNEKREKGAKR